MLCPTCSYLCLEAREYYCRQVLPWLPTLRIRCKQGVWSLRLVYFVERSTDAQNWCLCVFTNHSANDHLCETSTPNKKTVSTPALCTCIYLYGWVHGTLKHLSKLPEKTSLF